MTTPLDVVVVPDFSGKAAVTFEVRMLYFLASWIEFSGVNGTFPLQLACIGEPPESVKTLAKRCNAIITKHQPAPPNLGVYANKLVGFDVPLQTGRLALLDVDIFILSDLRKLADAVPADAHSANPSHGRMIFPEMFEELFARLGLGLPTERMPNFHVALDMTADEAAEEAASSDLIPTYNTGVIVAPEKSPLPALWREHLGVLGELRANWEARLVGTNLNVTDEPAFASAIHTLKRDGLPFVRLPDAFNCRWRNLYRRSPSLSDLTVFHMTSSFGYGKTLAEKIDPRALGYQKKLLERYGKRWLRHSSSYTRGVMQHLLPAALELRRLRPIMETLYTKHIQPVVR